MESNVGAMSKCEQRAVIKFLNAEGIKGNKIREHLCVVFGGDAMNRANMYKWLWFFNSGRTQVHNKEQIG